VKFAIAPGERKDGALEIEWAPLGEIPPVWKFPAAAGEMGHPCGEHAED